MRWDEWRFSATLAWRDPVMRWGGFFSFAIAGGTTAYMLWRLIPEGVRAGVLAMHYTMYLGIDDVRAWPWIFIVPCSMIGLLSVNAIVAAGVYRSDAIAARTLIGVSCALTVVWAVGSVFLVRINL